MLTLRNLRNKGTVPEGRKEKTEYRSQKSGVRRKEGERTKEKG
jgi:hypothetical protein